MRELHCYAYQRAITRGLKDVIMLCTQEVMQHYDGVLNFLSKSNQKKKKKSLFLDQKRRLLDKITLLISVILFITNYLLIDICKFSCNQISLFCISMFLIMGFPCTHDSIKVVECNTAYLTIDDDFICKEKQVSCTCCNYFSLQAWNFSFPTLT